MTTNAIYSMNSSIRAQLVKYTAWDVAFLNWARLAIYGLSGCVGSLGNAALACVVVSTPNLRSTHSLLLALLAVFDTAICLFYCGFAINAGRVLAGGAELGIADCVLFLDLPRGCLELKVIGGTVPVLACAVDRLLMLRRPVKYRAIPRRKYLIGWTALSLLYPVPVAILTWQHFPKDYPLVELCESTLLYSDAVNSRVPLFVLPLSLATLAACLLTLRTVNRMVAGQDAQGRSASSANQARKRRFQESLMWVLRVYVGTWCVLIGSAIGVNVWAPIHSESPLRSAHFPYMAAALVCSVSNNWLALNFFPLWLNRSSREVKVRFLAPTASSTLCETTSTAGG